jgi:hypothetical protein
MNTKALDFNDILTTDTQVRVHQMSVVQEYIESGRHGYVSLLALWY